MAIVGYVGVAIVAVVVVAWALRGRPRVVSGPPQQDTPAKPLVDVRVQAPPGVNLQNPLVNKAMRKMVEQSLQRQGLNPRDAKFRLISAQALEGSADDAGLAERIVGVWRAIHQAQQAGDIQQARGFVSDRLLAEWAAGASSIPPLPASGKLVIKIRHRFPERSADSMTVEVGGVPPGQEADQSIPTNWWTFTRAGDSRAWVLDGFSQTPPESTAA